jgi:hypothetical protein
VTPGTLQLLVKMLRGQRPWKVKKISFTGMFNVLQLPKKINEKRGKDDVEKI